jgi:hypothetical protein
MTGDGSGWLPTYIYSQSTYHIKCHYGLTTVATTNCLIQFYVGCSLESVTGTIHQAVSLHPVSFSQRTVLHIA